MKFTHFVTVLVAAGLVFLPSAELFAAKNNVGKKPATKKEIPPNRSIVSAVSDTSITITTKGGSKTYSIGAYTNIMVAGVRSKASDIKVGMRAMVGADSSKKATYINASEAPPEPAKKK